MFMQIFFFVFDPSLRLLQTMNVTNPLLIRAIHSNFITSTNQLLINKSFDFVLQRDAVNLEPSNVANCVSKGKSEVSQNREIDLLKKIGSNICEDVFFFLVHCSLKQNGIRLIETYTPANIFSLSHSTRFNMN